MTYQIKEERINNYSVSIDGITTDNGIVYEVRIVRMWDESRGTITKSNRTASEKAAKATYNRYKRAVKEVTE